MSSKVETFNKIMNKYRFVHSVTPELQAEIIKTGQKDLKQIYKHFGTYSILFAILLFIYNMLSRSGITVTFLKCKIILAVTAALIASAGIYSTKVIINNIRPVHLNDDKPITLLNPRQVISEKENTAAIPYIIGINSFEGTDTALAKDINNKILTNLKEILGQDKITHIDNKNRSKLPRMITGSVRKLGDSNAIIIKIINITTAKAEFIASEKFTTQDEIDKACYSISKRIAENIKP